MQTVLEVFGATIPVLNRLGRAITKYQERKKAREQVLDALGDEIGSFTHFYDEIVKGAIGKMIPLLDSMISNPSMNKLNDLIDYTSDFYEQYTAFLESFISLAKGCREVSANPAFMKYLGETVPFTYDFIVRTGSIVHEDSIRIDSEFYRFFKIYKKEIFGKLDQRSIEEVSEEASSQTKRYIKMLKRIFNSFKHKIPIKRILLKRFIRNYKKLAKVSEKVQVKPTRIIDLADFLPSEMLPVVRLLDETFPPENPFPTKAR